MDVNLNLTAAEYYLGYKDINRRLEKNEAASILNMALGERIKKDSWYKSFGLGISQVRVFLYTSRANPDYWSINVLVSKSGEDQVTRVISDNYFMEERLLLSALNYEINIIENNIRDMINSREDES